MRWNRIDVFVVALASLAISLPSVAGEKRAESSGKDHDFGNKVLYLVTKPKDAKSDCGYILLEKVRVDRLGDRAFLVGQIPDYGDSPDHKAAVGRTLWTPVSDIVQITEFKTVDDAKQFFETARKAGEQSDRESK